MKRFSFPIGLLLVLLCLVGVAFAQTWITANQATVAWDAVPFVAADDVIKYQVYTKFGQPTATPQKVGEEILQTQSTISFPVEGRYYVCVMALRYPAGETVAIPAERLACSDNAADVANGIPFGIKYFVAPNTVKIKNPA